MTLTQRAFKQLIQKINWCKDEMEELRSQQRRDKVREQMWADYCELYARLYERMEYYNIAI